MFKVILWPLLFSDYETLYTPNKLDFDSAVKGHTS